MSDNNSNPANSGYPPQYIHPNFEFNQQSNLQSEGSISNYLFPGRAEQQENLFSPYQGFHQAGTNDTRNVLPSMQQFGVNQYQSYGIPQEHPQPIPREFINTIDRKASNERNDIPGGGPHSNNNNNTNNNNYEHTNGVHVTMRGNVPQGTPSGNGSLTSHLKSNIPTGPTQTMPHGNQPSIQQQQPQHHQPPPHTRGVPTLTSNNNYALEKTPSSSSPSQQQQQQQSHPGGGYLYGGPPPDPSKLHHQISKSGVDNSNSNNNGNNSNNGLIDPSEMPRHIVNNSNNNIVNSSNHHPSNMQSTNQTLHSNINNQSITNNNNNGGGSPSHLTNSSSSSAGGGGSGGEGNYNSIVPFQESNQHYCDITEFLNMPQIEAAKKLQIPPSTLSKRWKEAARNRKWPWRTVRKIDKEITTLLHNVPPGASIPEDIEANLACLLKKRQEELKPTVIRL